MANGDQRPGVEGDIERLVERLVVLEGTCVVLGHGTRIRWPDDEIGRNSVSPCTTPSSSASSSDMIGAQ